MGFKTVYQCLTDVFPQIDSRLLRAVAIEHPKDADAAVEVVLSEILPFLGTNSVIASTSSARVISSHTGLLDGGAEEEEDLALRPRRSGMGRVTESHSESRPLIQEDDSNVAKTIASFSHPRFLVHEDDYGAGKTVESSPELNPVVQDDIRRVDLTGSVCSVLTDQDVGPSAIDTVHRIFDDDAQRGNTDNEELILLGKPQTVEKGARPKLKRDFEVLSTALVCGVDVSPIEARDNLVCDLPSGCHSNINVGHKHGSGYASSSSVRENGDVDVGWSYQVDEGDHDANGINQGEMPLVESPMDGLPSITEDGKNDFDISNYKQDNKIALLEEMVEAAKSNKKTLFAAMESVMNMIGEVELKEKAAELAKEEAARGGFGILAQVEELKNMIEHAKEANDMHAGEVYGEKAILATEARELQARLLCLSDERDNALTTLDKMRQTLNDRLAAAEDMRKAAEQEKLAKEECARNALAELESMMDKVAQESKMLQQQADENSKLREFLMDRGRIVDTLQGEISVICQDVRFLKERFDERVPLSKSISSSQTSCILASSGSSSKSMPPDLPLDLCENPKSSTMSSPASSVASSRHDGEPPKVTLEKEKIINCDTHPLDDGWEMFEFQGVER